MARTRKKQPWLDFRPLIKEMGVEEFIQQGMLKQIIEAVGVERALEEMGLDTLVAQLTPQQRQELRRRLEPSSSGDS